ncbi:MAG TPA: CPBP family intramembrane glutamic endopeptidase [Frankiaceae bacterium]|nr:CPBP family intramembrane glutamic endopeptidase [Frankiaceae bacterium]
MWGQLPGVTIVAGVLAGYLVIGLPLSGVLGRGELRRRLTLEPWLRSHAYRQAIGRLWLLAGLSIGITGLAKVPLTALGLRAPSMPAGDPALLPGIVLLAAGAAILVVLAPGRRFGGSSALLPSTSAERRLYAAVAVCAGVVEELLFRGFLIAYLTGAVGWSVQLAAVASALAFGISHLSQGALVALVAGIIGYGFAETYLLTGSLLVPVVVHLALDLRLLLIPSRQRRGSAALGSVVQEGESALEPVT